MWARQIRDAFVSQSQTKAWHRLNNRALPPAYIVNDADQSQTNIFPLQPKHAGHYLQHYLDPLIPSPKTSKTPWQNLTPHPSQTHRRSLHIDPNLTPSPEQPARLSSHPSFHARNLRSPYPPSNTKKKTNDQEPNIQYKPCLALPWLRSFFTKIRIPEFDQRAARIEIPVKFAALRAPDANAVPPFFSLSPSSYPSKVDVYTYSGNSLRARVQGVPRAGARELYISAGRGEGQTSDRQRRAGARRIAPCGVFLFMCARCLVILIGSVCNPRPPERLFLLFFFLLICFAQARGCAFFRPRRREGFSRLFVGVCDFCRGLGARRKPGVADASLGGEGGGCSGVELDRGTLWRCAHGLRIFCDSWRGVVLFEWGGRVLMRLLMLGAVSVFNTWNNIWSWSDEPLCPLCSRWKDMANPFWLIWGRGVLQEDDCRKFGMTRVF